MITDRLLGWRIELDVAEREVSLVARTVELLSEGVNTLDIVDPAVRVDARCGRDLIAREVVIANKALAGLVNVNAIGKFLAAEVDGESIPSVVSLVALADLEGIVAQVVVHDEGKIFTLCEEAEDLTIVV